MSGRLPAYRVLTRGKLTGLLDEFLVRAGNRKAAGEQITRGRPMLALVSVRRAYMPSLKPSKEIPTCAPTFCKS